MTDNRFKDPRLLEAFDHIDLRYIAEVADSLEFDPAPAVQKKTPWYSLKYVAAVAACALLLGAVMPVVQFVSQNFGSFFPGGLFGDTTEEVTGESLPVTDDLTGSESVTDEPMGTDFRLTYQISKREYMRGDIVYITASVENISGRDLTYTAVIGSYYPSIELYSQSEDGEVKAKIRHEEIDTYSGFDEFTAKAGQIGKKTYTFIIPKDAQLGAYAVTLSYRGNERTYEDVLVIIDNTSQYRYSPVKVSAGGETINPIRTQSSSYILHPDGSSTLGSDGMGVWNYFGKDGTDPTTFPVLTYKSNFAVKLPNCTEIYDVGIFDLGYKRINAFDAKIEDIRDLPAGEYLIVLYMQYDTSVLDPKAYEQYGYEDFFRLEVPDASSEDSSEDDNGNQGTAGFKKLYLQFTPELEPISEEQIKKVCEAGFEYFFEVTIEEYVATYGEENRAKAERISKEMCIRAKDAYGPYYGNFNGSIVYANISANFPGGRIVDLAGYRWQYNMAAHILVYNNGKVYTIEDAYEKGYLTDKDIATIAERHEKFEEYIGGDYGFIPET